jgi:hypothetical protein
MSFKREIDGYQHWMFGQFAAMCSVFAVGSKLNIPSVSDLEFSTTPGIVREGVVVPDPDRQYFEFEGGNVFSWSTRNCTEEQIENLYKMVVENVVAGNLVPKQILPKFYHNQVLAEAIKGNRKPTLLKYLELVGTNNG